MYKLKLHNLKNLKNLAPQKLLKALQKLMDHKSLIIPVVQKFKDCHFPDTHAMILNHALITSKDINTYIWSQAVHYT